MGDKLKIVKVYQDAKGNPNGDLIKKYKVQGYPSLTIFKDGSVAATKIGYTEYADLKSWVEGNL